MYKDNETTRKVALIFQILKSLPKGNTYVFPLLQQTRRVQCLYLSFEKFKISSKKGQQ